MKHRKYNEICTGILEIFLGGKNSFVKLSKQPHSGAVVAMRDVAILETKALADLAGWYAGFVVKYRFRIIHLTLDLLQAAVTICTTRHYGFMAHIQYRCPGYAIIRKQHQRLPKAITD